MIERQRLPFRNIVGSGSSEMSKVERSGGGALTHLLFTTPSWLSGVARVLDLGCTFDPIESRIPPVQKDWIALVSDFEAISQDLWTATNEVAQEAKGLRLSGETECRCRNYKEHSECIRAKRKGSRKSDHPVSMAPASRIHVRTPTNHFVAEDEEKEYNLVKK